MGLWLGDIRAASDEILLKQYGIKHLLSLGVFPKNVSKDINSIILAADNIVSIQLITVNIDLATDFKSLY